MVFFSICVMRCGFETMLFLFENQALMGWSKFFGIQRIFLTQIWFGEYNYWLLKVKYFQPLMLIDWICHTRNLYNERLKPVFEYKSPLDYLVVKKLVIRIKVFWYTNDFI